MGEMEERQEGETKLFLALIFGIAREGRYVLSLKTAQTAPQMLVWVAAAVRCCRLAENQSCQLRRPLIQRFQGAAQARGWGQMPKIRLSDVIGDCRSSPPWRAASRSGGRRAGKGSQLAADPPQRLCSLLLGAACSLALPLPALAVPGHVHHHHHPPTLLLPPIWPTTPFDTPFSATPTADPCLSLASASPASIFHSIFPLYSCPFAVATRARPRSCPPASHARQRVQFCAVPRPRPPPPPTPLARPSPAPSRPCRMVYDGYR